MRDFTDDLRALHDRVAEAHRYLRIDAARARLAELDVALAAPDLSDEQGRSKQRTSESAADEDHVDTCGALAQEMQDAEVLYELARQEGDDSYEAESDAAAAALGDKLSQLELRSL